MNARALDRTRITRKYNQLHESDFSRELNMQVEFAICKALSAGRARFLCTDSCCFIFH